MEHLIFEFRISAPFYWLRKPPALPVEVSHKKAFASSSEGNELLKNKMTKYQEYSLSGGISRLRAAKYMTRVKEFSMRLETHDGKRP